MDAIFLIVVFVLVLSEIDQAMIDDIVDGKKNVQILFSMSHLVLWVEEKQHWR